MQNRHKLMKKATAIITIIILLVMMLPMAAFAAKDGQIKELPAQASGQARKVHEAKAVKTKGEVDPDDLDDPEGTEEPAAPEDTEDPEETENPEEMSARATYVHARNDWAKSINLAPGHANLLDKLLAATEPAVESPETPAEPAAETDPLAALKARYAELFPDGAFRVQTVIGLIKEARIAERQADKELEAVA